MRKKSKTRTPKTGRSALKKVVRRKNSSRPSEAQGFWPSTRQLLPKPEAIEVDFKRDAEAVKPEDLVAFANAGGGVILVGVDEIRGHDGAQRGKIVGCDVGDRERNKIVSRASSCRPPIAVKTLIERYGKLSIMRVEIPMGGLHCTSSGTYKIRRDGQIDIIDPSTMVEIIVKLERQRILEYLRSALDSHGEALRSEIEERDAEAQGAIEDLRAELEDMHGQFENDQEWD